MDPKPSFEKHDRQAASIVRRLALAGASAVLVFPLRAVVLDGMSVRLMALLFLVVFLMPMKRGALRNAAACQARLCRSVWLCRRE
jgi:hypothetical protein